MYYAKLLVYSLITVALAGCGSGAAQPEAGVDLGVFPQPPPLIPETPAPTEAESAASDVAPVNAPLDSTRPGEDWPQFLGPRDNGISGETGLLKAWPAEGPPMLWQRRLGEGYAPPSVRGERLIVQHRLRDRELVECLHAQTGATLWKYDYETDFADPYGYNGGTRCAPVLSLTHAYTYGPQGKLVCVELATGQHVWTRDTAREFKVPQHFFGAGCTPILDGEKLIVLVGGAPKSAVVAFDAKTGRTLWESIGNDIWDDLKPAGAAGRQYPWTDEDKLVSYSTPVIAAIHGKKHLLCLLRQGLVSLNPDNGALQFKYFFRSKLMESVNAARPLVVDDLIFLSAAYDTGAALLKVKPDGRSFDEVWRKPRGMSTHWSTAVFHDGHVYGFSGRHEDEAQLQCVELLTGELKWETNGLKGELNDYELDPETGRIREKASGKHVPFPFYGRGSGIFADGKLILLGERGTLALVEPNTTKWVELARAAYPQIKYPSWAAPVLSRGRLYLRSETHVICLDQLPPRSDR
jgi:outer membrane protein assembly factor BamB